MLVGTGDGPDSPVGAGFVVVGRVHEAGEVLARTDGVEGRGVASAGRKRGKQSADDCLQSAARRGST